MGNRAVIITDKIDMGLYLHWHGSPEQVQAFLSYCQLMKFCPPEWDCYGWAQLAKVIGNSIDRNRRSRGMSIGLFPISAPQKKPGQSLPFPQISPQLTSDWIDALSPGDNGIYVIRDWEIIQHLDVSQSDDPVSPETLLMLLKEINEYQTYHLPEEELVQYVREREAAHGQSFPA